MHLTPKYVQAKMGGVLFTHKITISINFKHDDALKTLRINGSRQ